MTEFQYATLTLTLFSFLVLIAYLLYRVRSLQIQCDEQRRELAKVRRLLHV